MIIHSPHLPHLCFSLSLFLLLSPSPWRPIHYKHKNFCLIQFLLGFPGAQVQSGSVSICMEISYSLGIHWGHTSTTATQVRTYRDSAGGGNICVCMERQRNQKANNDIFVLKPASVSGQKKRQINLSSDSPTHKAMFYSTSLLNVWGLFPVSCSPYWLHRQDYSVSSFYISTFIIVRLLVC